MSLSPGSPSNTASLGYQPCHPEGLLRPPLQEEVSDNLQTGCQSGLSVYDRAELHDLHDPAPDDRVSRHGKNGYGFDGDDDADDDDGDCVRDGDDDDGMTGQLGSCTTSKRMPCRVRLSSGDRGLEYQSAPRIGTSDQPEPLDGQCGLEWVRIIPLRTVPTSLPPSLQGNARDFVSSSSTVLLPSSSDHTLVDTAHSSSSWPHWSFLGPVPQSCPVIPRCNGTANLQANHSAMSHLSDNS